MAPVATPTNAVHGSVPVVDTCFVRSMDAVWLATTVEAEAVLPVPPSVEVTAVVVLFCIPALAPVTVTLNVQLLLAVSDPPENEIVLGAVVDSDPLQVAVGPLLVTVSPEGRVSEKARPESELNEFWFVIVKLKVDVLPVKIEVGEKDFASTGGATAVSEDTP